MCQQDKEICVTFFTWGVLVLVTDTHNVLVADTRQIQWACRVSDFQINGSYFHICTFYRLSSVLVVKTASTKVLSSGGEGPR